MFLIGHLGCPKYGSLGDFVEFMNHAKSLGMRVLVDLVVNHTSSAHPWFRSARRGRRSDQTYQSR